MNPQMPFGLANLNSLIEYRAQVQAYSNDFLFMFLISLPVFAVIWLMKRPSFAVGATLRWKWWTKMKVAFIGLGVMGYPMAGHLQKGGHDVTVYNRNPEKAKQWVAEYGGKSAAHARRGRQDQDIVFCCVGRDSAICAR